MTILLFSHKIAVGKHATINDFGEFDMKRLINKIIKKNDMISDQGVHQTDNLVDIIVILGCIIISVILLYLGFMAYTY